MYLNKEVLKAVSACEAGYKWLERYFPDGAELIDIINHKYAPIEFVQWGYERTHGQLSDEEKAACFKKLKINCEDCKNINNSYKVENSNYVFMGRNVVNSDYVSSGKNIQDSSMIQSSHDITNCNYVFDSNKIENSQRVYSSNQIMDSEEIVHSNEIINSTGVLNGENVKNSFYIIGSLKNKAIEIYNSYFISNCKNISHCLFCSNIEQQNFMLFNKPISEEEYNNYLIQLLKLKGSWMPHFIGIWGEKKMPLMPPLLDNEEDYCSDIPKELLKWLETLPGFDEKILKDILKV